MKQHNYMQTSKCLMLVDLHVFEVLWVFLSMQIWLPVHRQMGLWPTEKRGLEKEILSQFVCSDAPTPLTEILFAVYSGALLGCFFCCCFFWKDFSSEIF